MFKMPLSNQYIFAVKRQNGVVMLDTIIGLFAAFLCIAGAVGIIKWCALRVASPKRNKSRIYAVMLKGDCADIELQMAIETLDWDSALQNVRAFAVDCGLNEDKMNICKFICSGSRFELVTPAELANILDEIE